MQQNDKELAVQKIRDQYTDREITELDRLKALDARVKGPVRVFAYVFGSLGAVVMGAGMSLVMTDLGGFLGLENPLVPGILVGLVGLVMAAVNYPVYRRLLAGRRKKYADQVLAMSDRLLDR